MSMSMSEKFLIGFSILIVTGLIVGAVFMIIKKEEGVCCNISSTDNNCKLLKKDDCNNDKDNCEWKSDDKSCPAVPGPKPKPAPKCCGVDGSEQGSCDINKDKDNCNKEAGKCKWNENGCQ
jgi:hypothetical protein